MSNDNRMAVSGLDTDTREGQLLYAALCMLRSSGPENVREKDVEDIVAELEKLLTFLAGFKM